MSFKRKGLGVIVSAMLGMLTGALLVGGMIMLLAFPSLPAFAQTPSGATSSSGKFTRIPGGETSPALPKTKAAH